MSEKKTIYAVDFDGTLCKSAWPEIGEANDPLIRFLKEKQREEGALVILWTMREGELLDQAVEWCAERGLHFDAVNDNVEVLKEAFGNNPRKVYADVYLDDHNAPYWAAKYLPGEDRKGEWVCIGHVIGMFKHPYSIDYKCPFCGETVNVLFGFLPDTCPMCHAVLSPPPDLRRMWHPEKKEEGE